MGTAAYSLSPAGAWKLLAEALPARPFTLTILVGSQWPNTGVDMLLNVLYDRLNAYVAFLPMMPGAGFDRGPPRIRNGFGWREAELSTPRGGSSRA